MHVLRPVRGKVRAVGALTVRPSSAYTQSMSTQREMRQPKQVIVLHAGSLATLVREHLGPALRQTDGISLESVPGHSVALAMALRERRLRGDVYLSADAEVNQLLLGSTNGAGIHWFVVFAHSTVVLTYSPASRFRADFEQARAGVMPWYEVLLQSGVRLRRNNPNHDPMGYYTLLVCALAERHYGFPGLARLLLGEPTNPEQIEHPHLAHLERGEMDAMLLYQSAALNRGLPYLVLPDEINLGNPALAPTYTRVEYTTDTGQTFHGKPISFSAAVLQDATDPQVALRVVSFLLSKAGQQLVQAAHFLPGSALVGGDVTAVPEQVQPLLTGVYPSFD